MQVNGQLDCVVVSVHLKATGLEGEDLQRTKAEVASMADLLNCLSAQVPGRPACFLRAGEAKSTLMLPKNNNKGIYIYMTKIMRCVFTCMHVGSCVSTHACVSDCCQLHMHKYVG